MEKNYPPLLLKYLKMYQDDPSSKIFAPLAEAYRKIGLIDQALEICLEGLQHHPHFIGGKVALARAYFDKKKYAKVREVLEPIIQQVPDNLIAQKILAESNLILGRFDQALEGYKMLLYFNPNDQDAAHMTQELETRQYVENPEKLKKLMKLNRLLKHVQDLTA